MFPNPAPLRQPPALLHALCVVVSQAIAVWTLATIPAYCQSPTNQPETQTPNEAAVPDSWNWVPAQVDFYWGGHQISTQLEQLESSSTVTRLRETKLWASVSELFLKEWKDRKSDLARAKAILDNPSARDVRKFLFDIASEDLFVVVDDHLSKSLAHWNAIQPDIERLVDPKLPTELRAEIIARWIDERLPDYQIPTMILGGKFSDTNAALSKIDEVEGLLRLGLAAVPDLRPFFKFLKRIEDPRGNRLTWTLNSEVIPWDSIPETDFLDRESLDSLRRELEGKTSERSINIFALFWVETQVGSNESEVSNVSKPFRRWRHCVRNPQASAMRTRTPAALRTPAVLRRLTTHPMRWYKGFKRCCSMGSFASYRGRSSCQCLRLTLKSPIQQSG